MQANAPTLLTDHHVHFGDSSNLETIASGSIDLVVTSPPYPMIEMWDGTFSKQDVAIGRALAEGQGWVAFERMHQVLDRVWDEVYRVLADGGFACINIGDATRTIEDQFALYPNHSRAQTSLLQLGFTPLPAILWRKPTNAPTKFMGSGMLPAGAYVTLEHEYVLILRKGRKRMFTKSQEKQLRRERKAVTRITPTPVHSSRAVSHSIRDFRARTSVIVTRFVTCGIRIDRTETRTGGVLSVKLQRQIIESWATLELVGSTTID